jgi:hypothetical protein
MLKAHLSRPLRGDVRGQGLVEYLLTLCLIAFATVAAQQVYACQKIPPGQVKKCSKKCE